MPIEPLQNAIEDEDGAVAVVVSLMLTVLLGFTALGVDVASLYRERAKLQTTGDLTALSAMAVPQAATPRATFVLGRNGQDAQALQTLETGRFLRNPAIAPDARFTPLPADDAGVNAVRVAVRDDAPLHFARIFSERTHVTLNRTALATRTGAASFSLSSHILNLGGVELNELLGAQFGTSAQINAGDADLLAETDVNLGTLIDALRRQTGNAARNPAQILDADVSGGDLVAALQSQLPAGLAAQLNGLQGATRTTTLPVSALVGGISSDLGLTATGFLEQSTLSALDVVRALALQGNPEAAATLDTSVSVPGVTSVQTTLAVGEPPENSGLLRIGEEGTQLHRAAARLKSEITIAPNLLGNLGAGVQIASVNLPLYAELAGATATLEELSCRLDQPQDVAARFSTSASPLHPANGTALAALYLGTLPEGSGAIDPATLGFADLLSVNIVIPLPLLPDIRLAGLTIQARSHVSVGTSQTEEITFTKADIAAGRTVRTFGSGDLLSSAVSGLLGSENTELRVKPGQQGLVSGLAAPVINNLLSILPARLLAGLATPVDSVLDGALSTVGLELGAGELTLTEHHCEAIQLVR